MIFKGSRRVFSTENDAQYDTIGYFWDEMAEKYGRENLMGLGCNWTKNTIDYVIALKSGDIEEANYEIVLPDDWTIVSGKTDDLSMIYEEIYKNGALLYEIEEFDDMGNCMIRYCR